MLQDLNKCTHPAGIAIHRRRCFRLLLFIGPPNGPVLFCLLSSVVCCRYLSSSERCRRAGR